MTLRIAEDKAGAIPGRTKMAGPPASLNDFAFGDAQLEKFASLAEEFQARDASIPLMQLGLYGEHLADLIAASRDGVRARIYIGDGSEDYFAFLNRLAPTLPKDVVTKLHLLRRLRNDAAHPEKRATPLSASDTRVGFRAARDLGAWYRDAARAKTVAAGDQASRTFGRRKGRPGRLETARSATSRRNLGSSPGKVRAAIVAV